MMKRNIMTIAFVAAIALIAGINVYNAQKTVTLSDIAMENVEALADCERVGYYTGLRVYIAENDCFCLNCPEPYDMSCNCR